MGTNLHFARQVCRSALSAAALLLMAGCQSFTVSSEAHLRIIDLSPDAASIDLYQGGNAIAYNLSYGTVTSYIPSAPGAYTLSVNLAGSKQVLSAMKGSFAPGGHYTVLVNNSVTSLQQVLLTDRVPESVPAVPSVRLIHQAPRAGPVDVYLVPAGQRLTSVSPIVTNLAPGSTTAYLALPTGLFTAIIVPAGTAASASTIPAHTGTQLSYEAGALRSLILIDAQPGHPHGLQVIATMDGESQN